ncbi:MAG: hypothetical protein LBC79_00210 [Deltaproteobacteria bacterium]|nr:hypothetical protein [Deltaproteobacteria bacterium]
MWPDDEAVVADMVAAAKERIPGLGSWIVRGDPELAPGDLVLEAAHSRVESRIEERRNAVDAALRHVLLPDAPEEEKGRDELAQVHAGAVARMLELVPKRPAVPAVPDEAARTDGAERPHPEAEDAAPPAEDACPATEQAAAADETAAEEQAAEPPAEAPAPAAPQVDLRMVLGRPPTADPAVLDAADAVDAVLAAGGFLPATEEA